MVFRCDEDNAAGSLPTPPVAGTEGYFQPPNPGSGITPVILRAWWLNMVQEELRGVVAAVGITPSKTANDQLLKAIRRTGSGGNSSLYSSNATMAADNAGLVFLDASSGNVTLTLPAANAANSRPLHFHVIRVDASANTATVQRGGSDTYAPGSATTLTLGAYEDCHFWGDGTSAWWVRRTRDSAPIVHGAGSGNDTVPAGYTAGSWECTGPGGGAGGGDATYAGGGGGAGGTARKIAFGLLPGATYAWVVGTGGAGGAAAGNGSAGSAASTVSGTGVSLTANAGSGGTHGAAPAGGDGGTATGGDDNYKGGAGTDGFPGAVSMGGNGGPSYWGGGGRAATSTSSTLQNGSAKGSGAGAGYGGSSVAGGAGADGQIRVIWKVS